MNTLTGKKNRGQLLMESLIATTIATVGILGMLALLSRSIGLTRVVNERYVASYLASEGIELVKNLIDTNLTQSVPWNSGITPGFYEMDYNDASPNPSSNPSQTAVLFDANTGFYGYNAGSPSRFYRTLEVSVAPDGHAMRVTSRVRWTTRGGAEFEINLEDHFFDWR